MRNNKVNVLKKMLGVIIVTHVMLSLSLFGASQVRIMPLGDSITVGVNNTDSFTSNTWVSYRGPLWTKLSTGGYNVDFVGSHADGSDYTATDPSFDLDHEGLDGEWAADVATNVTGYLSANPADVILLHIGTNDLDNGVSAANTVAEVNATLNQIFSFNPGIKVILAQIINQQTYDQKTTDFNNALYNMVQQRSDKANITIVDMENGAGIDYTTDMIELLHPNATGFEKMANLWYSALGTLITPIIPTHLWKLDETAGPTYVDSIGSADGNCTAPDGCPVAVLGQVNGAQSFDANDSIDVMDSTTFNWASDASFTIEFWMKTNIRQVDGLNNIMMGRANGAKLAWFIGLDQTNGNIIFGLDDSNDPSANTLANGTTTGLDDDKWHHIVVMRDGVNNENRIYVDGTLDGNINATYDADFDEGTAPVTIGDLNWTTLDFNGIGILDEIAVYNEDLSTGLILQHYKNGLKPHLAEVTAVPTSTTNTTPEYTFSSDKNGTIAYGGSCTSATINATVGDNTITFDAPIGTYNDCTITVTAADGNVSDPLLVSAFEVTAEPDVTAPNLAEVTPVSTPTSDTTPTYTFSSDEAGTITYGGSCTSATTSAIVGNNTITFDTLADGTYSDCTITVTDVAKNPSDPLLVSEFVVDTTVPDTTVPDTTEPDTIVSSGGGGGCTYNPNSKNFDMMFLLMITLGLFYPFRRRFIK